MDFFYILAIVILFVKVIRLSRRVKKFEKTQKTQAQPIAQSVQQEVPTQVMPSQQGASVQNEEPTQVKEEKTQKSKVGWFKHFTEWVKEDWIVKLGALFLLIGFGWLTTYAFLNNWIDEIGRITLGIILGALILILGWFRMRKFVNQGGVFMALGSTVILLTIFAARQVYQMFTPTTALVVMFLSVAFVALASVQHRARALSLTSLILASVAPLLTGFSEPIFLFSYLFVVVLGAIWIVAITGQRVLTLASLCIVAVYSLPYLFGAVSGDRATILLFMYAFAVVFFITNTFGVLKLKGKDIAPDLFAAGANGLLLLAWIMLAGPKDWQSLIIAGWMVVFAVASFVVFHITKRREPFYVYAGIGVVMLGVATAIELEGAALVITFVLEGAMLSVLAYALARDVRLAEKMSLLLILPVLLSFESVGSRVWRDSVFHKHFFVLLVLCLSLFGLGLFFKSIHKRLEQKISHTAAIHLIVGSIYAYGIFWLSLHASFANDDTAVTIALIIYTVSGLVTYFWGHALLSKALSMYGSLLLGFVVVRLLIYDVWDMAIAGRIVTFFLVGVLLMSTAFFGRRFKQEKEKPHS